MSAEYVADCEQRAIECISRVVGGVDSTPLALAGIGFALLAISARLEDK